MVLRIEYDKARGGGRSGGYGGDSYGASAGYGAQAADNYGYGAQAAAAPDAAAANPGAQPTEGASAEAWQAYAAYWAAYGYDVNDPQFQQWQASQMQGGAAQ